mmetsp:Transcript_16604/g.24580  ORF Transcript_16604/g.24580 Transcript_16604/m.24580 type:complete len:242 (-) Transcript_16604:13-738(-)
MSVANSYDQMNDLMSFGVHRLWKDEFVRMLAVKDIIRSGDSPPKILDVAGGTGDIAFRVLEEIAGHLSQEQMKSRIITVSDINSNMLEVGLDRAKQIFDPKFLNALDFVEADAENLPFEADIFDLYTISFGLRNVTDIPTALKEAFRVLKPGGRFMCLEFSYVENNLMRSLYDAYSFNVIPKIGSAVAKDEAAYKYLVESIRMFPRQRELKEMMGEAGFGLVTHKDMTFGVVSVHSGFKIK